MKDLLTYLLTYVCILLTCVLAYRMKCASVISSASINLLSEVRNPLPTVWLPLPFLCLALPPSASGSSSRLASCEATSSFEEVAKTFS